MTCMGERKIFKRMRKNHLHYYIANGKFRIIKFVSKENIRKRFN